MKEDSFSQTALKTACYRAYHAGCDNPKVFDDFLAYDIVGELEFASFKSQMLLGFKTAVPELAASFPDDAAILAFMMQAMAAPSITLSRARYAEEQLEKAISSGLQQYVNLGAGMDTFAFRRKDLLEDLHVFELDHPMTQAYKRQRITDLGWKHPAKLQFIPVDFNQENLAAVLKHSSYDSYKPAFFSWLGVSYYLSPDTVLATLRDIAAIATSGSTIIFDYLDTEAFVAEKAAQRIQALLMLAANIGEVMQMGFNPSTIAQDLAAIGLQLSEDLNQSDIQKRYFQGRADRYYACEHAHLVCALIK